MFSTFVSYYESPTNAELSEYSRFESKYEAGSPNKSETRCSDKSGSSYTNKNETSCMDKSKTSYSNES